MTPVGLKFDRNALVKVLVDAGAKILGDKVNCPFHSDTNASGGVFQDDGGAWRFKCHACAVSGDVIDIVQEVYGDSFKQACTRLGVENGQGSIHTGNNGRAPKPPAEKRPAKTYPTLEVLAESMLSWSKHVGGSPTIYNYPDVDGDVHFAIIRIDFDDGRDKVIRPAHCGDDGWSFGDPPGLLPLYHLDHLNDDAITTIIVCEGEFAADAVCGLGLRGTTSSHGAKAARKTGWQVLAGKSVTILPDNDAPGLAYANEVARIVTGLNPPATVRIVNLKDHEPRMPDHGDAVEYLELQGDARPIDTRKKLLQIVAGTPEWRSPVEQEHLEHPRWRPFPTKLLPETLRRFVREGAKALGCDESFIALPALSVLASAIGNSRRIRLSNTWTEPTVLWTAVVADSGTLKSPAFDLALKPLRDLQSAAMVRHARQIEEYEKDLLRHECDVKDWKNSGRKQGHRVPEQPKRPVACRYVCSDTTLESLSQLLEENPRGLLLARDELSGLLKSFDAYRGGRGGDIAQWLEMHRAGSVTVDRKTGKRTTHVPRASVSICGTIQIGTLRECLTPEYYENGFSARFLLAAPPKRKKVWTEADLPYQTLDNYVRVIDGLLSLQPSENEEGQPYPLSVKLSPAGKTAWVSFYTDFAELQNRAAGDLAKVLSKLEGTAARLALIFHLVRQAEGDETIGDEIDEQSVKAGASLVWWFAYETKRLYGVFAEDEAAREDRELCEFIERHGGRLSVHDIQLGIRRFGTASQTRDALNRLVKGGFGSWLPTEPRKQGGRPTELFCLSSGGSVYKTPRESLETGFVDVDGVGGTKTQGRGVPE